MFRVVYLSVHDPRGPDTAKDIVEGSRDNAKVFSHVIEPLVLKLLKSPSVVIDVGYDVTHSIFVVAMHGGPKDDLIQFR